MTGLKYFINDGASFPWYVGESLLRMAPFPLDSHVFAAMKLAYQGKYFTPNSKKELGKEKVKRRDSRTF